MSDPFVAPVNELLIAKMWLTSKLKGDAQLAALIGGARPRVFDGSAKGATQFPYVVFQLRNPNDVMALGAIRVMVDVNVLVKGIHATENYGDPLASIARRIDAVLHGAEGPVGELGYVYSCVRQSPFEMPETAESGAEYRHLGGEYHLQVQGVEV